MTGDGVNDVLALRDADCSVAMASGSDAATQAAQLVLLESDFSRMPDVVAEGRRVVNNLERSGSLFLVKNVFSFLTATFAIIFAISYPVLPRQISFVAMFTIGTPGFLLSQAPNYDLIRGSFVSNILRRAVPGGVTDLILVGLFAMFCAIFQTPAEDIGVCSTILLMFVGLQMIYRVAKKPLDWYKRGIIAFCAIGATLGCIIPFCAWFFGISPVAPSSISLTALLAVVSIPLLFFVGKLVDYCWTIPGRIKTRRKA